MNRWRSLAAILSVMLSVISCSSQVFSPKAAESARAGVGGATVPLKGTESNVLAVKVSCGYSNEPCVSVTVCETTPSTKCVTIDRVLLDTGSYGLRVFASQLSGLNLVSSQDSASGRTYAECINYLDGTSQWGPVKTADIVLGGVKATAVPIQVIDSGFPTSSVAAANCASPESSNDSYNGILGIGNFAQDCGSGCTVAANNQIYFACSSSSCASTTMSLERQVANPLTHMDEPFSNGSVLQMSGVSEAGGDAASGYLILGIATMSDNTPSSDPGVYLADTAGNISTTSQGTTYTAFLDSGSNGVFFPQLTSALVTCSDWYCPDSTLSFSVEMGGAGGSSHSTFEFSIANAKTLFSSGNMAFNNLGGYLSDSFDWGMPFFLGRTVFIGVEGKTSRYGTGPYWLF